MNLDTTKLSQKGQQKLTPHDNCTVLDLGTGSFPRLIELRLPGVDGARQSALWDGSLDLAINDKVIADEYAGQTVWRVSDMGGGDSGAGKQRVSKVWESDFENAILTIGATGQTIFQPAVDSTTFLQVLDADGGTPIVNINSVDEIASIGIETPLADGFGTHKLSVYTTSNTGLQFGRFSADTGGPVMSFVKSRGALGVHGAASAGDRLGTIAFGASDGVDFLTPTSVAQIYAEVDAITGGTVYSGKIVLQTTTTAGAQNDAVVIDDAGGVGIGTSVIPHGGVGAAKLAIEGTDSSLAGPHAQFTTPSDNYPLCQMIFWAHDNLGLNFDSYWDGAWRSSDAGSNFQIFKNGDLLRFRYDSGIAQGSAITWNEGIVLDINGNVGIGTATSQGRLHGYGSVSGFLYWEYDGLDGTSRTVIPNGTGDVLYRLIVEYIIRSSAGPKVAASTQIDPAGSVGITVGADTVTIAVAADGSVTTSRTAGTNTHKVVYRLLWL